MIDNDNIERLFYIGKVKKKELDRDFDLIYDKFIKKAIDKGHDGEIVIKKEKTFALFYIKINSDLGI